MSARNCLLFSFYFHIDNVVQHTALHFSFDMTVTFLNLITCRLRRYCLKKSFWSTTLTTYAHAVA